MVNEESLPVVETDATDGTERLAWVRPEVRRLRAGSAEDGAGANPDAGINPS